MHKCDMTKSNQSEVRNSDFDIQLETKEIILLVAFRFCNSLTVQITGTNCPVLMGVSAQCNFTNGKYSCLEHKHTKCMSLTMTKECKLLP